MDEELIGDLDQSIAMLRELVKQHRALREQNTQLHSLAAAMENDQKKASRLINEHERMERDRERLKSKISDLVQKLDKLRV